jgi:hypothetical protein
MNPSDAPKWGMKERWVGDVRFARRWVQPLTYIEDGVVVAGVMDGRNQR